MASWNEHATVGSCLVTATRQNASYGVVFSPEPVQSQDVVFGERLAAAASIEPARWLDGTVSLESWTVGGLLPEHYESYLLIEAVPPSDAFWEEMRQIATSLADVLIDFTDTPAQSWFAIWEGHGFGDGGGVAGIGSFGGEAPPEEVTEFEAHLHAVKAEGTRRKIAVRDELRRIPRFDLPTRSYYLLGGAVTDVEGIRWPGDDHWFQPDLWWPEDRTWFVGTDVDFWCTYVGGTAAMADAITARLPDLCQPVSLDERLRIED